MIATELVDALGLSAFSSVKAKAIRFGIHQRCELHACRCNEDDVRHAIRAFVNSEDLPDCRLSAQQRALLFKAAHEASGVSQA